MKSTFLFLVATTMMTCTALGQSSNDKKNVLPDWAFGGFERPQGANPVISPIESTKFYCPMTQDYVAWESNDTFNPAATLYNGKIVAFPISTGSSCGLCGRLRASTGGAGARASAR